MKAPGIVVQLKHVLLFCLTVIAVVGVFSTRGSEGQECPDAEFAKEFGGKPSCFRVRLKSPRADKCLADDGREFKLHFDKDDRWLTADPEGRVILASRQGSGDYLSVTKVTPPNLNNPTTTDEFIYSGDYIKLRKGDSWFAIRGFGVALAKREAEASTLFLRGATTPRKETIPGCPDTAIRDGDYVIIRGTIGPNPSFEVSGDQLAVRAGSPPSEETYHTVKVNVKRREEKHTTSRGDDIITRYITIESKGFGLPISLQIVGSPFPPPFPRPSKGCAPQPRSSSIERQDIITNCTTIDDAEEYFRTWYAPYLSEQPYDPERELRIDKTPIHISRHHVATKEMLGTTFMNQLKDLPGLIAADPDVYGAIKAQLKDDPELYEGIKARVMNDPELYKMIKDKIMQDLKDTSQTK